VRGALLLIFAVVAAAPGRGPAARLSESRLDAVHAQRIEWKKKRPPLTESLGALEDYRTLIVDGDPPAASKSLTMAMRDAEVQAILPPPAEGIVIYRYSEPESKDHKRRAEKVFDRYPDEVVGASIDAPVEALSRWDRGTENSAVLGYAVSTIPGLGDPKAKIHPAFLRAVTTHVLSQSPKEQDLAESLAEGHAYVAHDWLADPAGFAFFAETYFGVFEMGDQVTYNSHTGPTMIQAHVPIPAKLRLLRNGDTVAEASGQHLMYEAEDEGAYRLEVALNVDGEDRPWIFSNPLYVRRPWDILLPSGEVPPSVELHADITYTDGASGDADKHKLDLFIPKGKRNFPVVLFAHGGGWRTGDRSLYRALGNRLAREGIAVAIPSYRLMGLVDNPHPAQVADIAAAFAWVYAHIGEYGGDASRFYVSGHSAGGHLVSLIALDGKYLAKYQLSPSDIRGVISLSGVYDVQRAVTFNVHGDRKDASPIFHVSSDAPRFLVAYCQWDLLTLPKQARSFSAELRKKLVSTQLLYIPRDNHITEIINITKESGPLIDAVLKFIQ
jgi:acetyl esterase/lipase